MSNKLNRHERLLCPYKPKKGEKKKVDTREKGRERGVAQSRERDGDILGTEVGQ